MKSFCKMPRARLLLNTVVLTTVFSVLFFPKSSGYDFGHIGNRIGWVNEKGHLSIWLDNNWKLPISKTENLPVKFHFSVNTSDFSTGVMGKGWSFPLFESSVIEESEEYVRLNTLGGDHIYLIRDPKTPNVYDSRDYSWSGLVKGKDGFEVKSPDGWTFLYAQGWIEKIISPGGRTLNWKRTTAHRERVQRIEDSKGNAILEAEYTEAGLIKSLHVIGGPRFSFATSDYPEIAFVGDNPLIKGLGSTVSKITLNSTPIYHMEPQFDGAETFFAKMRTWLESGEKSLENSFSWNAKTGQLSSDGKFAYAVKQISPEGGSPQLLKLDSHGKVVQSYFWDISKRLEERQYPNGETLRIYYVGTPGKIFGQVRRTERLNLESGIFEPISVIYFDNEGRVQKSLEEGMVNIWQRSANEVTFLRKPAESSAEPSAIYTRRYDDSGSVMSTKYKDGTIIEYKTNLAGKKIAVIERNGVKIEIPVP